MPRSTSRLPVENSIRSGRVTGWCAALAYNRGMSQSEQMTLSDTARFLKEWYGPSVTGIRPLGAGAWSQAFAFRHDGVEQVMRWSRFADNFARDAFAARFGSDALPIPEITARGKVGDLFYAVAPFAEGAYLERLPRDELERTLPALLELLHGLRRVDLADTSGFGIWNGEGIAPHSTWRGFLLDDKDDSVGSLITGWRANLAASPLGMEPFERLWRRFEPLVERCPDERQLVHSDTLNGNVLAAGGRITALLDWGSSFFGDALFDVAWFVFYQPWFPQFGQVDMTRRLLDDYRADPQTNKDDLDARLRCYLTYIGLDSIAYNAFRKNWPNAQEAADYTWGLLGS
jgi:hygromycin-B 4-O-kinase